MTGIPHEDSYIADSIISPSSPSRPIHECPEGNEVTQVKAEPLKVKRITKTYGRSKAKEDVEDAVHRNLVSRARILKTAPRDADDQVIPESDDTIESGPKFAGFGWRKEHKDIDAGVYSTGDGEDTLHREATHSGIAKAIDTSSTRRVSVQTSESRVPSDDLREGNSLFDSSLSSLLSEPPSDSPRLSVNRAFIESKNPAVNFPRRVIGGSRTSDSDEASPKHPYSINTPKRQSSSTPPTSPFGELGIQDSAAYLDAKLTKKGTSSKSKAVERRSKALMKKEVVEMQKESARILADRHVSIERPHVQPKHTVETLFQKLEHVPTTSKPDSDPIVPFSSPGDAFRCPSDVMLNSQARSGIQNGTAAQIQGYDAEVLEELPDGDGLLRKVGGPVGMGKRAMGLEEQKRKALEAVQCASKAGGTSLEASDTDDDLEVEAMVSRAVQFKNSDESCREGIPQTIRSNKITIGSTSNRVCRKDLEQAAASCFVSKTAPNRQRGHQSSVSRKALNELLLRHAESQGGAIEEKKKEQWVKTGGVLKEYRRPVNDEELVADGHSTRSPSHGAMETEEREEEEADGSEYEPGDVEYREGEESDAQASDTRVTDGESGSVEDADADKENYRPPRKVTARAIVNSDDEDEMSYLVQTRSPVVFAPDTSLEDDFDGSSGGDKENSAELAFSVGENKENEGVPRHPERGRIIYMSEPRNREILSSSSSPVASREPFSRLDIEGEFPSVPLTLTQRRDASLNPVLQVLHEATLAPIGSLKKEDLHRRSASMSSEPDNLDGSTLVSPIGFSQLFDATRVEVAAPGPVLDTGGFSQFFSQGSDNGDEICATPLQGKMRSAQIEDDNFEFTQPNTLLPSIKLSESQRREVDVMFGKDQEFKLDEAKATRNEGEHATRSDTNTLHFGSFVPSQIVQTPRSVRRPLETLSLADRSDDALTNESPQSKSVRSTRLLRERPRGHSSASHSPPRNPRNAFDVLRDAAFKSRGEHHSKRGLEKSSEYVEVEAQESDEEAMIGFGGAKTNDNDEQGENDPNLVVEGLVDDTIVDEKADLVLQKHMEHQAIDDAALEKLHQDAVDGKLRGKRRDRGIGFEDSDSDEDDLSSSRKPMYKKRRVDGDTLDDYGKNSETLPFYNAYQVPLTEPDESVAYIQQDDTNLSGEDTGEDNSGDERTEAVDPIKSTPEPYPENVNWVDSDDQDVAYLNRIRVEDGPMHPRKVAASSSASLGHMDYSGGFQRKKHGSREERQLKFWASQESRAHTSVMGRGGFSRKDSTTGSVSRKPNKMAPIRDSDRHEGKAIVKQSSLISHVEKRQGFNG